MVRTPLLVLGKYEQGEIAIAAVVGAEQGPLLLAMGEIAANLALSQAEAREVFAGRFSRFAGPAGQQRVRALLARPRP